jgi:IstB-like ATP binding protein
MVAELSTHRLIEEKHNVILLGPPGVGKTHGVPKAEGADGHNGEQNAHNQESGAEEERSAPANRCL